MSNKIKKNSPLYAITFIFIVLLIAIVSLFYLVWTSVKQEGALLLPEKIYTITGKIAEINEDNSFTLEITDFAQEKNADKTALKVMVAEKTQIQRLLVENNTTRFALINFSQLTVGQYVNLYAYQDLKGQSEVRAKKIEVLP